MEHLKGLNEAQKDAVLHTKGPLLVLAGAGAGKTRVITHRILQLVREGVAPDHILAITFTNKAANEMRERALHLLRTDRDTTRPVFENSRPPFVSTFHSLGLTIIKENFRLLGFKRTPVICDRGDSLRIIKDILKPLGNNEIEPRAILSVISRHKGDGLIAEEFAANAEYTRDRFIASIWKEYDRALTLEGALDFDDLLARTTIFLRKNPEMRAQYQTRWPFVHIDEYQDTNGIQAEMAELIIGEGQNICAVGDIDQTIYSWRGAQIANILSFDKKFPGSRIILLEENYRSTKTILAAANQVITKNIFRREKNLFTKNADGERIGFYQAYDEVDEASFISRKINELKASNAQPKDVAVLYRANFQSRAIEEALLAAEIPYQVLGTRFFERKEVKDILSYIRAALYDTSADIARVANVPARGIGKVTLLKILAGQEHTLTSATRVKVMQFRTLLTRIKEKGTILKPSDLITFVLIESGLERALKEDKTEGAERMENVRELGNLAARYDTLPIPQGLENFLESAALASDQDDLKEEKNSVRLMTVHASKGLEFPYVFIVGLEEGLFPYEKDGNEGADKEEERRLMYVALTRAEKKLFLSAAALRTVFGAKRATLPSQFLSDITDDLLELESPERLGKTIYLD